VGDAVSGPRCLPQARAAPVSADPAPIRNVRRLIFVVMLSPYDAGLEDPSAPWFGYWGDPREFVAPDCVIQLAPACEGRAGSRRIKCALWIMAGSALRRRWWRFYARSPRHATPNDRLVDGLVAPAAGDMLSAPLLWTSFATPVWLMYTCRCLARSVRARHL